MLLISSIFISMTLTNKEQLKRERRIQYRKMLDAEHQKLAHENALLLDFAYMAAASKRVDGNYNNCRESLQRKAVSILDKINK